MIKRGRPKKEANKVKQVNVRLSKDDDRKLDSVCFDEEKTRAEVIREALKLYFRVHEYRQ